MSITLKEHNVEPYRKVNEKMKETNKVAVIHPTGTGKMFIALKFLEDNKDKKALYVAPSNAILHEIKKNIFAEGMTMQDFPNLKRITYQKLASLSDEKIKELGADIIVLDEFHHCGAPEWGKGVERLLQSNEDTKVLGLSATPLRYFDGLRDMADELFENNVASEMTLEEAIEKGILPEATYVSSLYGYNNELTDMQQNIDKITNQERKEEAQNLLNVLRAKLDENTQNLPELLSEYMQKDGKYIVFCKNIEDMNEKIEQTQKIFGKVNTNVTIRGVSSKIKETEKILTEFEQDKDEGKLKLLFAVNMLDEGYHISDLDGVIMMRPTYSPRIFTQQLGRALTVGGEKNPVILDLVNNFDQCKIIEDLAERMKEYEGNEGKTKEIKKSRLSIFDRTKEFREIAEKIVSLSARKSVSLEEKIQIFEKFSETGEELSTRTLFEGYPIGQWAAQIRSQLNKNSNERRINPTEEQLERLKKLGILESRRNSLTVDEKIDAMVEWRKNYPKAKISPRVSEEVLGEYAKNEEEKKKLLEEYNKIIDYYSYIRTRTWQGAIDENQILKCKDGNVGGVFGYPRKIEELAKKYNVTENDISYLLAKYGTLDEFYEKYKEGEIVEKNDRLLSDKIIKKEIDFDSNPNTGYDMLIREITGCDGELYYSKCLIKEIEKLSERKKYIIYHTYGLADVQKPEAPSKIAKQLGIGLETEKSLWRNALMGLRRKGISQQYLYKIDLDSEFITDDGKEKIMQLKKDIQIGNGNSSDNLEKLKIFGENINMLENYLSYIILYPEFITDEDKNEIAQIIREVQMQNGNSSKSFEKLEALCEKINNLATLYAINLNSEFITDEEKNEIMQIRRDIQMQNGNSSESLEKSKALCEKINKLNEALDGIYFSTDEEKNEILQIRRDIQMQNGNSSKSFEKLEALCEKMRMKERRSR